MKILLTFDVEEFDVPEEYGQQVSFEKKIEVSTIGLERVITLIKKYDISCTFFVTATYALEKREMIKSISDKYEIASHGYYHSSFKVEDLLTSKEVLENITGKTVNGFRMARMANVDDSEIEKAGYKYNSSINPTYIPGRYNHRDKPRTSFYKGKVLNVPVSVSPTFRIPLFWLSFKNFPFSFYKSLMKRTLKKDKMVSLYFHPWEFTDITPFGLPGYISKHSGDEMLQRLEKTIIELKKLGTFITMDEFVNDFNK